MYVYWFNDGTIIFVNHELTIPEYVKSKGHGGLFIYAPPAGEQFFYDTNPETGDINIINMSQWN